MVRPTIREVIVPILSILARSLRRDWSRFTRRISAGAHSLFYEPLRIGAVTAPWSVLRPWVHQARTSVMVLLCIFLGLSLWASQSVRAEESSVPAMLMAPHLTETEERSAMPDSSGLRDLLAERSSYVGRFASRYGISDSLAAEIADLAAAEGIDPDLAFRLVRVESVFDPRAVSSAGALGLTQLMPSTARAMNPRLKSREQILDRETNLRLGFRYLRDMLDRYNGDLRLALVAYNRGPHKVDQALRTGQDPYNGYDRLVLGPVASGNAKATYRGSGRVRESEIRSTP